ncbi:MAG: sucrose phosphorylase [Bacteroidota bacterium]
MENKVQLITYVNRFGGNNLEDLHALLAGPLKGIFSGVHLLPFFYPIDGEDAGFDPINHTRVDPKLGDWDSIARLSQEVEVMADLITNHISADSAQFQDVLEKGDKSDFASLFLTYANVFPQGATEQELSSIYRPRPGFPFSKFRLKSGEERLFWTTFTPKQIDIDVQNEQGQAYLHAILDQFRGAGIGMIRIDAVGYAIKTPGTSCFMTPETYAFIGELSEAAKERNIEVLVEIHAYYKQQIEIAKQVDRVYDFALPPLILHTLFKRNSAGLKKWLTISPRNAITVLDTHDGIGIVDIGAGNLAGEEEGLIAPEDIDDLVEMIHEKSEGNSRKATGAAASNLDLYQVNCTYFDALGRDEKSYLLARLIQFFVPGIPQIYYVGFLAGENDMDLLDQTGVGRDINRQYFSREEVLGQLNSPIVRNLCQLIRFRNEHPAFNGVFELVESSDEELCINWTLEESFARLRLKLSELSFSIEYSLGDGSSIYIEDQFDFYLNKIKA